MFKHVIWDFDGTLFDTYPAIVASVEGALKHQGVSASPEEILPMCKITLQHALDYYRNRYHLNGEMLFEAYLAHYQTLSLDDIPPFQGLRELMEMTIPLGVKHYVITHRPLGLLMQHLTWHHVDHYFTDMITSDDKYPRKPDPAAFIALGKRCSLPMDTTLGVGDRDIDIYAARGAGFKTCLFQNNDLSIPADYTAETMDQVCKLILG